LQRKAANWGGHPTGTHRMKIAFMQSGTYFAGFFRLSECGRIGSVTLADS
jgi:hypothetical protein